MRSIRTVLSVLLFAAVATGQGLEPAPNAALTGRAEGRVLGALGEAMVAIEVRAAVWPALDTAIARTRTDGNGYFVLPRLPLRSVSVLATADGHTVGWGTVTLSAEQPTGGLILRLWPASAVRGRVVDVAGQPVADAIVLGTKDYTWFEGRFRSPETRTDAAGTFSLQGVPIGKQVVRVWKPGFVMEGVAPTGHKVHVMSDDDKRLHTTDLFGVGVGQTVEQDIRLPAAVGRRD